MSTVYTAPRHTAAQEALIAAYIRLHGVMPRHRIKVMDICREAPAARSTFYLYYDSVNMLKDDIENAEMYEIVRHTDAVVDTPLDRDMMDFLRDTMDYIRTK